MVLIKSSTFLIVMELGLLTSTVLKELPKSLEKLWAMKNFLKCWKELPVITGIFQEMTFITLWPEEHSVPVDKCQTFKYHQILLILKYRWITKIFMHTKLFRKLQSPCYTTKILFHNKLLRKSSLCSGFLLIVSMDLRGLRKTKKLLTFITLKKDHM